MITKEPQPGERVGCIHPDPENPRYVGTVSTALIELPNGSWVDPLSVRAISKLAPSPQESRPRVAVVHRDGWEIIIVKDGSDPVAVAAELASKVNQFRSLPVSISTDGIQSQTNPK